MENDKIKEIEERLEKLEAKVQEQEKYMKSDIKQELNEKEAFKKLRERIDFVDEKVERQKRQNERQD